MRCQRIFTGLRENAAPLFARSKLRKKSNEVVAIEKCFLVGGAEIVFVRATSAPIKTNTDAPKGVATHETWVDRGEIIYLSGNDVRIKMEDGQIRHVANVPERQMLVVRLFSSTTFCVSKCACPVIYRNDSLGCINQLVAQASQNQVELKYGKRGLAPSQGCTASHRRRK